MEVVIRNGIYMESVTRQLYSSYLLASSKRNYLESEWQSVDAVEQKAKPKKGVVAKVDNLILAKDREQYTNVRTPVYKPPYVVQSTSAQTSPELEKVKQENSALKQRIDKEKEERAELQANFSGELDKLKKENLALRQRNDKEKEERAELQVKLDNSEKKIIEQKKPSGSKDKVIQSEETTGMRKDLLKALVINLDASEINTEKAISLLSQLNEKCKPDLWIITDTNEEKVLWTKYFPKLNLEAKSGKFEVIQSTGIGGCCLRATKTASKRTEFFQIVWNKDIFEYGNLYFSHDDSRSLTVKLVHKPTKKTISIVAVHFAIGGKLQLKNCDALVANLESHVKTPVLIAGDFNLNEKNLERNLISKVKDKYKVNLQRCIQIPQIVQNVLSSGFTTGDCTIPYNEYGLSHEIIVLSLELN
ncbi:hypothetical protein HDV01_001252 [Terramyces sp. JEL0728]|nr:hypothetical protein HDV01_001252 [Terramyces sp. JEL0728]